MEPRGPKPKLNFRMEPGLKSRIEEAAIERFQGNEAMLMRDALETYLDLRESLGFDFDRVIQPMRAGERELVAS